MKKSQSGFTLMEVVVAIGILAIVFMALAYAAFSGNRLSATAAQVPGARAVLSEQLSLQQQKGYRALNTCGAACNRTDPIVNGIYRTTWTITPDSTPPKGFVTVSISTTWTVAGITRTFTTKQLVSCLEDEDRSAPSATQYPECPA